MVKDHTRLADEVNAFEKVCFCEKGVDQTPVICFYRGLIDGQPDAVEEAIMTLLSPEKLWVRQKGYRQTTPGLFMAKETMSLAKLAWINGYEIEIDHPLIISELLPDEPNKTESKRPPFLIDPGLETYDFWHYDGKHSDQEVEQHNQAIFNERIPSEYEGVTDFVKLPPDAQAMEL